MIRPADVEDDGKVDALPVHAGDELLSGGNLGIGARVEVRKAGVSPQAPLPILPYPGREDMGVEIYNHALDFRGDFLWGQANL